jgi:hypothetical protein
MSHSVFVEAASCPRPTQATTRVAPYATTDPNLTLPKYARAENMRTLTRPQRGFLASLVGTVGRWFHFARGFGRGRRAVAFPDIPHNQELGGTCRAARIENGYKHG